MISEWNEVLLRDVVLFNPKEMLPKGTLAKKVAMEHVLPHTKSVNDFTVEAYKGGSKFRNGDTIMARITPCLENGKTAKIDFLDEDEVAFGSTEFIVLRGIEGKADSDFVYYLSISPVLRDIAIKSMVGSSGRQRVQQAVLEEHLINIPPLYEQKAIAATLSCLDDKIELNKKIIANLEGQAQAIFKNWFVDFEPFCNGEFVDSELGPIPKGWTIHPITIIADYLNGLAMQKFRPIGSEHGIPVIKIRELRQGACDSSSETCSENIKPEYIVNDGDVIFSWSGSLMVDIWCGGLCGLNQHLFKVTSKSYDKWYYYFWTKHYMSEFAAIAAGKATTMGHIKRSDLEKALAIIPDKETYDKATAVFTPIINLIIARRVESRTLSALRNTLLPKLLNGELEVPVEG